MSYRRGIHSVPLSCLLGGLSVVFLLGNIYLLKSVLDSRHTQYDSVLNERDQRTNIMKQSLDVRLSQRADIFYLAGSEWRLRDHVSYFADHEAKLRRLMDTTNDSHTSRVYVPFRHLRNISLASIIDLPHALRSNLKLDLKCDDIGDITDMSFIAAGWTKAVYRGNHNGRAVAVKIVDFGGHDIVTCQQEMHESLEECYGKSAAKIIKEIALLRSLIHTNILKVYGYCIPNNIFTNWPNVQGVAMVTELGEPVDIIKLLQMSWEDRLRVALGMARILVKLAHSSHGSLAMNDFRRQQFVLVDGVLKLADVDDVTAGEPTCNEEADCLQRHPDTNLTLGGKCINHCCSEFNERRNIMNGGRQFVSFFLEHGVPRSLLPLVMKLSSIYTNVTGNTRQLSEVTETLAHMYINGSYLDYSTLKKHRTLYKVIHDADLPGMFDYRCQLTLSANGCSFSVFNVREAEEVCSADTYCKAFILAKEKTWTGRTIVHLKNNFTTPVRTTGSLIYVKPQPG